MYADQRYIPHTPRTVGLGGSLAISGLLIAGLISFVPNIVPKAPGDRLKIFTPKDVPPPPPEPTVKPEAQPEAQQPLPYVPPTVISHPDQPVIASTDIFPIEPPQPTIEKPGPTVIADPPLPMPLIGAQRDPRFADGYQPEYPSQELRAQRDGTVSVRVLIGTDGRVKAVEQINATSAAFFEATKRQALGKWRFKPATRGGIPQESWKTMSVRFELKNA